MSRRPLWRLFHGLRRADDDRSDVELLDRFCRSRDPAAFEAIVRKHGPRVLSAARHVLGASPDAEDVFQAAFLALVREVDRIRRQPALGGWLYSVAHRLALRTRADAARRERIEGRWTGPAAAEPPDLAVREVADVLHEELNRLPDALRLPLLLCYFDGMTRDEAARELGVGVDVFRGRLERGRSRLHAKLLRRGVSLPTGLLAAAVGSTAVAVPESLVRAVVATAVTASDRAVHTLRLKAVSMILTKTRLAVAAVAAVCLVSAGVVVTAAWRPDMNPPVTANAPEPAPQPAREAEPPAPVAADGPLAITGRVVDEAGVGAEGAEVRFISSGPSDPVVVTDRSGAFRLPLPPDLDSARWSWPTVSAATPDGRRLGLTRVNALKDARDVRVTLLPARASTVRVTNAAKQPVAGARVVLVSAGLGPLATATTIGDGSATVRYPAGTEIGFVFALKEGAGFDYVTTLKTKRGRDREPLPDEVALTLSGARTVRVKAVDGAGKPVAGLTILPWYIQLPGKTENANIGGNGVVQSVTDATGVATFDWIPVGDTDQGIPFMSHSPDYSYFELFSLKPGAGAADGTMRMIRKARLTGRVIGADGKPAAGIAVEASGRGSAFHHGRGSATTRPDGTYEMSVNGEEAYVVGVVNDMWAAACRSCVVARAGTTVGGLDFRLAQGTVLRGRMTVGDGKKPAAGEHLSLQELGGEFPEELRAPGDTIHHFLYLHRSATTDADGNYRFCVGPGNYNLMQSNVVKTTKITVGGEREVVTDLHLTRPNLARLAGTVVDAGGRPVAGAVVQSTDMGHTSRIPFEATTAADGSFSAERVAVPAAVYARSADKSLAGLVRITADQQQVTVRVGPLATARGRLLDHEGKPIAGGRVKYGVHIPASEEPNAPYYVAYGGVAIADGDGWYTCTGMLVGEKYHLSYEQTPDNGPWMGLTTVTPTKAETISVGDTKLAKPRRPPTPEEKVARFFAPRGDLTKRVASARTEAGRYHQRVLLVAGDPREAATRALVELIEKQRTVVAALGDFERVVVSADDAAGIAAFQDGYDRDRKLDRWPALVVLGDDGKALAAKCPLLDDPKAAAADIQAFLAAHARMRPDAKALLTAAQAQARTEGKRVFLKEGASWCGPCRLLSRFLEQHRAALEPHFVFVDIDSGRYAHGSEVMERYRGKEGGGIPWCAVLDADGKMLANWNGPDGNIGFPTEPKSVEHFLRVLADTAPKLTADEREKLARALQKVP
ncbi:sigma-70 family RNA polymerase sigma factor [Gemmata sp. JC717]|uniref:sigma-70 family RNA polymerase sigma factor n=1 Tax=Gemmata algarum TaxID=2975278 RepID=UPI0021BAFBEF|nr:sigma-70 family RNA polymerase sigma factor [Gemmata algarum]MDY3556824.1 sigma-70 family RNA polymerase sigma factor [Gemmata algarum]